MRSEWIFTFSQGTEESEQGRRVDFAEHSCQVGIILTSLVELRCKDSQRLGC